MRLIHLRSSHSSLRSSACDEWLMDALSVLSLPQPVFCKARLPSVLAGGPGSHCLQVASFCTSSYTFSFFSRNLLSVCAIGWKIV